MSTFANDLIESLTDAVAHARGEPNGARVTVLQVPDVRALREELHMTQTEFAEAYGIPLATLKGWEQGRRHPDATASAYLHVIAKLPRQAREALQV